MSGSSSDTLLLAMTKDNAVKIGPPPNNYNDRFDERAADVGKINDVSRLFCGPDGDLFCVCNGGLYVGPLPSKKDTDWLSTARKVGKSEWERFKLIAFHPDGDLYATTDDGRLYKGPKPDNEYVSWMYGQATEIGSLDWQNFEAMFFHPNGDLYAVHKDNYIVRGAPPETGSGTEWVKSTAIAGHGIWLDLTYFMSFSSDGKLWSVSREDGNIYRGWPKDSTSNYEHIYNAENLGCDYNSYKFLCFTKDRTMKGIVSFEFLPEQGKVVSENSEVVEEMTCNNRRSSSTLHQSFSFSKTIKHSSSFTKEHSFRMDGGTEITFKAGIPCLATNEVTCKISLGFTKSWIYNDTNENEDTWTQNLDVKVDPGKAIRLVASVVKAELNVPYRARIVTMFGREATIEGMWNGTASYNMTITQEDYEK